MAPVALGPRSVVMTTGTQGPRSGSATAGGTDYESLEGSVTIPDGSSSATITVTPVDDAPAAVDDLVFSMMCFSLIGGILAFLIYNWQPAVIFMGDTGAMVIGMMLSILAIRFMNVNAGLPDENPWPDTPPE